MTINLTLLAVLRGEKQIVVLHASFVLSINLLELFAYAIDGVCEQSL